MQQAVANPGRDSLIDRVARCPICEGALEFLFSTQGSSLEQCAECGLILRNPPLQAQQSSASRLVGGELPESAADTGRRRDAEDFLDRVEAYARNHGRTISGGALLLIGENAEVLLEAARSRGYRTAHRPDVHAAKTGAEAPSQASGAQFDVCVISGALDFSSDPATFLQGLHDLLAPGTIVAATLPNLGSRLARAAGPDWPEFRSGPRFFFNRDTARSLFFRSGFSGIEAGPGGPSLSRAMRLVHWLTPGFLRRRLGRYADSELTLLALRSEGPPPSRRRHKLSVVLPLFNEAKTFREVMDALLAKRFEGMDLEVVVVESNSKDGSREAALEYKDRPGVKIVLEDQPRGKGFAVRNGLGHATGDFIVIQDADLEYDLDDYERLLAPLRHYRKAFVLGSRHSGSAWKIRHFEDAVATSSLMNLGHIVFTALFNILYGQRLKDPFTMYKVFWRDCLHTIAFECNRFDFDWELMAKLVRRGYLPAEIPINYQSRSFGEGKKVRFFRDPPSWIRAAFKYRFINLDKEKARERAHARHA